MRSEAISVTTRLKVVLRFRAKPVLVALAAIPFIAALPAPLAAQVWLLQGGVGDQVAPPQDRAVPEAFEGRPDHGRSGDEIETPSPDMRRGPTPDGGGCRYRNQKLELIV